MCFKKKIKLSQLERDVIYEAINSKFAMANQNTQKRYF
jgi:hypothetical protein